MIAVGHPHESARETCLADPIPVDAALMFTDVDESMGHVNLLVWSTYELTTVRQNAPDMTDFANGKIEAFAGPTELGAPHDLEGVIVDFAAGARHSLDVAVQEIDSEPLAQALIDARFRGVSVRVFLEQDYLLSPKLPVYETSWDEQREPPDTKTNRDIFAALLRCNVDAKADYNPAIFHQKFAVRDYRGKATSTSALLTGSANWTTTDTHSNLNHVLVFHDARVCAEYQREFDEIRSGSFGRRNHGDVPRAYNLKGVPVKVLFAPDHTPELEIVKQMLKAESRMDFAIFTFAGSSGIDDAMVILRAAGRADPRRAGSQPGAPVMGGHPLAARQGRRGVPAAAHQAVSKAPPQADGDRRRDRGRRQLQLHRSAPTSSTTRTSSCSAAPTRTCRARRAGRSTRRPAPS